MQVVENDLRPERLLTTKANERLRHGLARFAVALALVVLPPFAAGCQLMSSQPEGVGPRTVTEFLKQPRPGSDQPRPGSGVLGP